MVMARFNIWRFCHRRTLVVLLRQTAPVLQFLRFCCGTRGMYAGGGYAPLITLWAF
jgi:hypothetical protein